MLALFDFLSVLLSLLISRLFFKAGNDDGTLFNSVVTLVMLSQPLIFAVTGLYRTTHDNSLPRDLIRVLSAWTMLLAWLLVLTAAFKVTAQFSRFWFGLWAALGLLILLSVRIATSYIEPYIRQKAGLYRNIVLIGDAASLQRLVKLVTQRAGSSHHLAGYFCEQPIADPLFANIAYLGDFNQGTESTLVADQLWLAFGSASYEKLRKTLVAVQHTSIPVRLVPNLLEMQFVGAPIRYTANITMLELNSPTLDPIGIAIKTAMDFAGALIGLLLLSPLLLLIAAGIRLSSPGPALFRQEREGFNGKTFTIYKFRTMHIHVEKERWTQAQKNDPRIFPFGQLLRRLSLDELPQLLNVLRGDMSLVGPRPHVHALSNEFRPVIEFYGWRNSLKPGITGWAQVNGFRGETETPEKMRLRVEHDLYYIRHWSPWLDIEILLLTLVRGFIHPNAY